MVRPLLRGWSHALAAVLSFAATIVLLALGRDDPLKELALALWGLSSMLLFGVSAVYHIGTWSPPVRARLRRLDHANIFVLIAGTYTPFCVVLLDGAWRIAILSVVVGIAAAGIATVSPAIRLPRGALVGLYLAQGWVVVVATPRLAGAIGALGLSLLISGGLLYSLGAVVYALRRPRLWPRVFGYHEAFHLLVILASTCFFLAIVFEVLPVPRA